MTKQRQKEVGLLITLTFVSALYFWLIAAAVAGSNQLGQTPALIIVSIVWVALAAVILGLIEHPLSATAAILIIVLLLVLVGKLQLYTIAASLLLAPILLLARSRIRREIKNHITVRPLPIFYHGTRLMLLGLIVAITGLTLPTLIPSLQTDTIQFPEQVVQIMLRPFEQLIQSIIPGYTNDATINELLEARLQQQIDSLPPGTTITQEQIDSIHQQTADQPGETAGHNNFAALVTDIINEQISVLTSSGSLLPTIIVITLILFVTRLFIPLLAWPTLATIMLLIFAARRTNLVELTKEKRLVERLHL